MNKKNFPLLKIIGWLLIVFSIFPGLFPTAILWFKFQWWFAFAFILIVILSAFILGVRSITIATKETISLLYKAKFALIIVSGFYSLIFSSIAISWVIGAYNNSSYLLFLLIFSTDAILFAIACWFSVEENFIPVPKLLIYGGILSLPIGLFAIIMGAYYSKKIFVQLNITTNNNIQAKQDIPIGNINYTSKNVEYECSECHTTVKEEDKVCPNCGANLEDEEEEYECSECHASVKEEDKVCPNCGANLEEDEEEYEEYECSECHTTVKEEDKICPNCGANLED